MSALTNFTGPLTPEDNEPAQRAAQQAPFCAPKDDQRDAQQAPFCAPKDDQRAAKQAPFCAPKDDQRAAQQAPFCAPKDDQRAAQQAPFCAVKKDDQRDAQQAPFYPVKIGSSMNALKHGFSSKKIIVMAGQEDDFLKLQSDLVAEVRPEGTLEQTLFQQFLRDAWTLHRVELQQVGMADSGRDPLFDPDCEKEFDRLERYHSRYQSSFHKSLRELRTLQTNRIVQSLLPEPLGKGSLPATVKATEIVALAKRTNKSWTALAINTLIEATKRSKEDFSSPIEAQITQPEAIK